MRKDSGPRPHPSPKSIQSWLRLVNDSDASADDRQDAQAYLQELSRSASDALLAEVAAEAAIDLTFWSAQSGDVELLRRLIANGLDLKADTHRMGSLGDGAFYQAAAKGQVRAMEMLLDAGADPNAKYMWSQTPLHSGAESGSVEAVRLLLGRGLALNAEDSRGHTPLMLAAQAGHLAVVRELIQAGADVNPPQPSQEKSITAFLAKSRRTSALILAVTAGYAEIVSELIAAGADLRVQDGQEHTAYDVAEYHGNKQIMNSLLRAGALTSAEKASRSLLAAAADGNTTEIKRALDAGADSNAMQIRFIVQTATMVQPIESGGRSALMLAAEHGHADALEDLIAAGANKEAMSDTCVIPRRTALHFAAVNGSIPAIEALLDAGADLAAQQEGIEGGPVGSALHLAAGAGHVDAIKCLIRRGLSPEEKSPGRMPLHSAARHGRIAAADALLAAGASVNARTRDNSTPLIEACAEGQAEMVRFLLSKGADPDLVRKQFGGALHAALACSRHGEEHRDAVGRVTIVYRGDALACIRELIAAGANVNLPAQDGETPLISASGQEQFARLLLDAGADVHSRTKKGDDAIYWAVLRGSVPVVTLLIGANADLNRIYNDGKSLLDVAQSRGAKTIVSLLKHAGAKSASALAEGRAAASAIEKARKAERQQLDAKRKADEAIRPDFTKAARSKKFRQMVERLEEISGRNPEMSEILPGLACVTLPAKKANELQQKHRDEFARAGAYLFRCGRGLMDDDPDILAVLATDDQFQVPPAMGTNGANFGKGPADVVAGLRKIHAECPFIITKATFDTVEGQFTKPIKRPAALAGMLFEFCPDIVDQGTGTVRRLAAELKRTKRLFLWWD